MTAGAYAVGAAYFAGTTGACLLAAERLRRRRLAAYRGVDAVLAYALVASGLLCLALLVPGATGLLTRAGALVSALLVLAATWALTRTPRTGLADPGPPPAPASPPWSWALAGGSAALLGAAAVVYLRAHLEPVTGVDATSFELPTIARWMQLRSFWALIEHQPALSGGTYPHTGNLVLLSVMLPWDSAWAVRVSEVPFWLLTGAGTYALARELRAPAATSLLAAVAICAMPMVAWPALKDGMVDAHCLAWLTAGALFLLRAGRSGARRDLLLAGLGLGLAFGAKWYAVPFVPALLVLWALARREWRRPALVAGAVAVTGGFWLLRNWVVAGNPLYPSPVHVAGVTVFDAPRNVVLEQVGWTLMHYATDWGVWRTYLLHALTDGWGAVWWVAVPGVAVAAAVAWRRSRTVVWTAAAAVVLAVLYARLPYSAMGPEGQPLVTVANTRYGVPALVAALACLAWLAGRAGRCRVLVEGVLALAAADAARRTFADVALLKVAAVVVLAGLAALAVRRVPARIALAAAAVVALVGGGLVERSWSARPGGDPALAYVASGVPAGSHVAIAGTWVIAEPGPVLAGYGTGLRNRVTYMGRLVHGTMTPYTTRDAFVGALRGVDVLVVGRAAAGRAPEWAREAGFGEVVRSDRFVVYRSRLRDRTEPATSAASPTASAAAFTAATSRGS